MELAAGVTRLVRRPHVDQVRGRSLARHHAIRMDHVHIVHVDLDMSFDVFGARDVVVVTVVANQLSKHLIADKICGVALLPLLFLVSHVRYFQHILVESFGGPRIEVTFRHELLQLAVFRSIIVGGCIVKHRRWTSVTLKLLHIARLLLGVVTSGSMHRVITSNRILGHHVLFRLAFNPRIDADAVWWLELGHLACQICIVLVADAVFTKLAPEGNIELLLERVCST